MNPYAVLGISPTASTSEAKAAYRKLAQQHHPDKGGTEAKFKEIKAAWEAIESGRVASEATKPADAKPYTSSFSDAPGTTGEADDSFPGDSPKTAGRPASGYEARGPRKMPKTRNVGTANAPKWEVDLEISSKHAFEGCVVPFVHRGMVLEHTIRPGTRPSYSKMTFVIDETIGSVYRPVDVMVRVSIVDREQAKKKPQEIRDDTRTIRICALGLFSGGKIDQFDNLKELVPITIPQGYDPSKPIVIKGKGFGPTGARGDMVLKIEPVFKDPKTLTASEMKMLQRVIDLTK